MPSKVKQLACSHTAGRRAKLPCPRSKLPGRPMGWRLMSDDAPGRVWTWRQSLTVITSQCVPLLGLDFPVLFSSTNIQRLTAVPGPGAGHPRSSGRQN